MGLPASFRVLVLLRTSSSCANGLLASMTRRYQEQRVHAKKMLLQLHTCHQVTGKMAVELLPAVPSATSEGFDGGVEDDVLSSGPGRTRLRRILGLPPHHTQSNTILV